VEYVGLALVGVGILLMYGAYKGHDPLTAVVDVLKTGQVKTTSTAPPAGTVTL
jgi:hypothetical protein